MKLDGKGIKKIDKFKCLVSTVGAGGRMDEGIKHRIQAGWNNWRAASGALCDKRVSQTLKGKFHKAVVRPAMLYGTEMASMTKTEKKLDIAEMRALRWMSGATRNEYLRGSTKSVEISKKVHEGRLRWYGHLQRREKDHIGRHALVMEVQGRGRRGTPRKRWRDCVREDLREKGPDEAEAHHRGRWEWLIQNIDPI
ncbi:uncharacterized protein [Macrobrachium rosenbergii]|uniref:uncharacterized protein n=1 Tax=Macrobrachium rosenbergii TaxID=79674 RepID=UPI0034D47B6F